MFQFIMILHSKRDSQARNNSSNRLHLIIGSGKRSILLEHKELHKHAKVSKETISVVEKEETTWKLKLLPTSLLDRTIHKFQLAKMKLGKRT